MLLNLIIIHLFLENTFNQSISKAYKYIINSYKMNALCYIIYIYIIFNRIIYFALKLDLLLYAFLNFSK